jgi:putative peptidoglycan lipid II flippase
MRSSGQKLLRSAALLAGLSLLAKATGVLVDVVVAARFGTSSEMDAFLVAASIAGLMFACLQNPLQVIVIPLFTQHLATRGERSAWADASILINTLIILFLLVAVLGWLLSPYLVLLVAPGFSQESKILSVDLTRFMMLTLIFLALARLLSGFFHSYQRFGWPGMIKTADHLVTIPSLLLLTPLFGIYGLVISTILGSLTQALVQLPILWKNRSYYKLRVDFKNPTLRRVAWMGIPLLVGAGGNEIGKISDRIFASLLSPGSLSALRYGDRLTSSILQLFVTSLTTVLFPFFSKTAAVHDYRDVAKKLFKSLRVLFWITLPLAIGIIVVREPLIRLIYNRGAFGEESVQLTSQAVLFYAVGLPAFCLSNVLGYAFYSLQDTKTPVVMGVVRLGVKILVSYFLVGPMAHGGLALAESLSFAVKAVLLLLFLPTELKLPEYRGVFQSFGVTAVITAAMGPLVFFTLGYLEELFAAGTSLIATVMSLGGATVLGIGIYLVLSVLLRSAELKDVYQLLCSGFAKKLTRSEAI